jgi:signal transduction histidine kinase
VIFRPDEEGELVQVARLRAQSGAASQPENGRNFAWREIIRLCEEAMSAGKIMSVAERASGDNKAVTRLALPLAHNEGAAGALLLRLRDELDERDREVLEAVGAQLARDLQRDAARTQLIEGSRFSFFSARSAARCLESFGLLSGLLTEQRCGAEVLRESADAHAIAYLDGTIAFVNRPMLEAAGLTEEEAAHSDVFGLLDRFRAGVFDDPSIAVRRVLRTGDPYECELNFPERGRTFALRLALIKEQDEKPENSRPACLALTARDVTLVKEHEELKSDMVSLMSHEMRTPITSINGFAELLAQDETLPEETREFLSIIRNESQRLSRMINTFLAVAQLQAADKQEFSKIPLKLDDVVRETVASLQPVAKKKRIRLVEQQGARLPPIAADKSLITQAVSNLLDNAIKYSPERTTVTVSTVLEAEAVRVSVEDRGYGIPPEAVDRVWDKFYRVARDGREKDEESTGLGLSFVREVVEQHGGSIGLESEVGRGSKFTFTLPRL